VLDLILGSEVSCHAAVSDRKDVSDLPDRVLRVTGNGHPGALKEAQPLALDGIVIHHKLEHAGVVSIDPERQLCVPGCRTKCFSRGGPERGQIGIKPLPIPVQPCIVDQGDRHNSLEDAREGGWIREPVA
jgi:hypothetical protein